MNSEDGWSTQSVQIQLVSPSRGQQVSGWFSKRLSGNRLDGTYEATLTLPAYSEQGTWTVGSDLHTGIYLADRAGNYTTVSTTTLAAAGYPTTIEVLRTE